jgi:hypothetical protein
VRYFYTECAPPPPQGVVVVVIRVYVEREETIIGRCVCRERRRRAGALCLD